MAPLQGGPSWIVVLLLLQSASSSVSTQELDTTQFFAARQLFALTSYKDVQLFRYHVPEESTLAQWTLWSNGTRFCDPIQVKFHLRWKGFPLLNVNNASIGDNYLFKEREQYQVKLQSDSVPVVLNISNPLPGDWFGLAYISQVDDRIVQKGLFRRCQAWFSSSLESTRLAPGNDGQRALTIVPGQPLAQQISGHRYYRFYVPLGVSKAKISISQCKVLKLSGSLDSQASCPLHLYFRASGLPDVNRFNRLSDCSEHFAEENCQLSELIVSYGNWNYLLIDPIKGGPRGSLNVDFQLLLYTEDCSLSAAATEVPVISTTTSTTTTTASSTTLAPVRTTPATTTTEAEDEPEEEEEEEPTKTTQSTPRFATENLVETEEATEPAPLSNTSPVPDIEPRPPYTLPLASRIRHGPHHFLENSSSDKCPKRLNLIRYNSQGNFAFKYDYIQGLGSLNMSMVPQPFLNIGNSNPNLTQLTLIDFEITPILDGGGVLAIELGVSPTSNTTYHNISVQLCLEHAHAALTFGYNCLKQIQVNTSLDEAHFTTLYVPLPRSGLWFITLRSSCYFHDRLQGAIDPDNTHPVPCEFNTTAIVLNVKSTACVNSLCSAHGKCNQYVTGGLIFSTCACKPGWKGWSCEDGSQVEPEERLLFNFLLLTLSNLMFIPAVILATCRQHFTEGLVYAIAMISSGLYHACESQCDRAFCLVNLNILQFGDFYSALLAFWVTLVSLGNLPDRPKAFLHTFGGIFIAFVVEYDRTSLWAFAGPSGLGAAIMLFGWVAQCVKQRNCYPSGKHWACSILPGATLAAGGLVVYAFFETKDNYAVTHSIWHAAMGVALLFLVPTIMRSKKSSEKDDLRATATPRTTRSNHIEWRPHTSFKFLRDDVDML